MTTQHLMCVLCDRCGLVTWRPGAGALPACCLKALARQRLDCDETEALFDRVVIGIRERDE